MDHPPSTQPAAVAAERYRTLLEINNAIISSLTREALFHAIAGALRRVVPFDRTAIFLHEPARDVLRLFVLESALPSTYFVAVTSGAPFVTEQLRGARSSPSADDRGR